MTIREVLSAMGYTEVKPGKWLKPIGFQVFSFTEKNNEWANWFRRYGDKKIECWEREELNPDVKYAGPYLYQLKRLEAFTRTNITTDMQSEFELIRDNLDFL